MSEYNCGLAPYGNQLVVKPIEAQEKRSVIMTPTKEEKSVRGIVVAVGPGSLQKSGELRPLNIKVGTKVMFRKYAGSEEFEHEGTTYLVLREDELLGELIS